MNIYHTPFRIILFSTHFLRIKLFSESLYFSPYSVLSISLFRLKMGYFSLPFVFLLISSLTHLRLVTEGRPMPNSISPSLEENAILRAQIGSRPPRCERRCSTCKRCEAIQVPTNPIIKDGDKTNTSSMVKIEYARGEDDSNYKPMSWKCKCGNNIFNP